jgi:hypothetical protein
VTDPRKFKAPYNPKERIWQEADRLRAVHPAGRSLPVKVLDLAEFDLGLDLVPADGLREQLDIEALLMGDLRSILVDRHAFMSPRLEYRLRFSVAHEIGHLILHRDIYDGLKHATAAEWFNYISAIPDVEYGWVEWQAYEFAGRLTSLKAFEKEHHRFPPRIVVHKTSGFTEAERRGCEKALDELRVVKHRDLLVVRESDVRLFRSGIYAPLRGSFLELDSDYFLLYTRGSVPFFEMYPGLYIPRALEVEMVATEQSQKTLAQEILALSKMNWNNTQFDSSLPITVRAARQVGDILKYAGGMKQIQTRYAFYM